MKVEPNLVNAERAGDECTLSIEGGTRAQVEDFVERWCYENGYICEGISYRTADDLHSKYTINVIIDDVPVKTETVYFHDK